MAQPIWSWGCPAYSSRVGILSKFHKQVGLNKRNSRKWVGWKICKSSMVEKVWVGWEKYENVNRVDSFIWHLGVGTKTAKKHQKCIFCLTQSWARKFIHRWAFLALHTGAFVSLLTGEFTTMTVINPQKWKLVNRNFVHWHLCALGNFYRIFEIIFSGVFT